ncbi:hypothetical protein ACSBR1_027149 [Camellia fascicularis]
MVRYNLFHNHFHGCQLETHLEIEQYTRSFLIYLIGSTLFANKWNTVGLYLLSALVTLSQVRFYGWGGAGLATPYGYMSSNSRKKGNKVGSYWRAWELWAYAYFPTLALVLVEVIAPAIPYSCRYDDRCRPRRLDDMTVAYYHRCFDMATAREITWQPWAMMPAGIRDQDES